MIIIHDKRLPAEYVEALKQKVPSASLVSFGGRLSGDPEKVYESISCHPDIYFFQIDERTVIHAPGLLREELGPLRAAGVELIEGADDPRGRYPCTARYGAARVGKVIFHNLEYTDPVILKKAMGKGLKTVNVSQAYARCSALPVGERAAITADKGMAEAVRAEGMDVLVISPGSVLLPGEKYGFIGGAGGIAPDGAVLLLGDIVSHPEGEVIQKFLTKHAEKHHTLKSLPLYDAGSLMIFD